MVRGIFGTDGDFHPILHDIIIMIAYPNCTGLVTIEFILTSLAIIEKVEHLAVGLEKVDMNIYNMKY